MLYKAIGILKIILCSAVLILMLILHKGFQAIDTALQGVEQEEMSFVLTGDGIAFLERICHTLPGSLRSYELYDMDVENFIFGYYTAEDGLEEEPFYNPTKGYYIPYGKVGRKEAEDIVMLTFGEELPEPSLDLMNMHSDRDYMRYDRQKNCYYVELSEYDNIAYQFDTYEAYRDEDGHLTINVEFKIYPADREEPMGEALIRLSPCNNKNGFVINDMQEVMF